MSIVKRELEATQDRFNVATEIAIEAGVLERCEFCEATVFQGGEDVEEAYKLGNTQFSQGELVGVFASRREMTDAIKAAVESSDHAAECCFHCTEKMYGDD